MKKLDCYLRTNRRQWGFSQKELSFLLGLSDRSLWARYEKSQREPSLRFALACEILFDASARDLFPKLFSETEEALRRRAYVLHTRLKREAKNSAVSKIELLSELLKGRITP